MSMIILNLSNSSAILFMKVWHFFWMGILNTLNFDIVISCNFLQFQIKLILNLFNLFEE